MKPHPYADAFPLMKGEPFERLVADIRENGLLDTLTTYKDPASGEMTLLDGRNRERACEAADVKPRYTAYKGTDPAGFVWARNALRRQLTAAQKAMAGAKLADILPRGRPKNTPTGAIKATTQGDAAKLQGVGARDRPPSTLAGRRCAPTPPRRRPARRTRRSRLRSVNRATAQGHSREDDATTPPGDRVSPTGRPARMLIRADADACRWEAAELITAELESGKTQRQVADEIEMSQRHVGYMAKALKIAGEQQLSVTAQERSPFGPFYQEAKTPATPKVAGWPCQGALSQRGQSRSAQDR